MTHDIASVVTAFQRGAAHTVALPVAGVARPGAPLRFTPTHRRHCESVNTGTHTSINKLTDKKAGVHALWVQHITASRDTRHGDETTAHHM